MITGGCSCGAVRYEMDGEVAFAGLCHCRQCRRASGSGHIGFMGVLRSSLRVTGPIATHSAPGASGLATVRNFCPACGSQLFGAPEIAPEFYTLYAGSLDDPARFRPEIAMFVAERAPWDEGGASLVQFQGAPEGV
jgi:hypothetical protein